MSLLCPSGSPLLWLSENYIKKIHLSANIPPSTINSLKTGTMPYLLLHPWCLAHSWDPLNECLLNHIHLESNLEPFFLVIYAWRFWIPLVTGHVIQGLLDWTRGCDVWRVRWRSKGSLHSARWLPVCMFMEVSWLFIYECQGVYLTIKPYRANC